MITRVELTNFQSHSHLVLEMGKFTVLTGGSNSGKSAVLRALAALVRNDSVGDYVTHGKNTLKVKVTLDSGTTVEWIKGKNENSYRIVEVDGGESHFQKVGSEVPEEVKATLGLSPLVMEGGQKAQVNIHEQLEAPFLIQDTPGHVAKVMGELTSASKLYTAVSEGNKKINRDRTLAKTRKGDLEKLVTELEDYADVERQVAVLKAVRDDYDEIVRIAGQVREVKHLDQAVFETSSTILGVQARIKELEPAAEVDLTALEALATEISEARSLATAARQAETRMKAQKALRKPLKAATEVEVLDDAETVHRQLVEIAVVNRRYLSSAGEIESAEEQIRKIKRLSRSIDKKIEEAYTHLETCPSCGQELTEDAKEALVSERSTTKV